LRADAVVGGRTSRVLTVLGPLELKARFIRYIMTMPQASVRVTELTWGEYGEHVDAGGIVILPVGSTEQHGHHLPLATDTLIATRLAELVATDLGAVVAPALGYGFRSQPETGGGEAFPGSTGISGATLAMLVCDVVMSLAAGGATRIIVLNGHYENASFIVDGVERAVDVGHRTPPRVLVARWAPFVGPQTLARMSSNRNIDWSREHAGVAETSLLAALCPELVRPVTERARVAPAPKPYQAFPQPSTRPAHDGLLAPAGEASAELGQAMIEDVVTGLARAARVEFGME
jgi:creatinine amidohydrolase